MRMTCQGTMFRNSKPQTWPSPLGQGDRHRRGAAMMEFILVFPVYALLLGGLFLMGEMLSARLRLIRAERMVTWGAEPGDTNQLAVLEAKTKAALWVGKNAGAQVYSEPTMAGSVRFAKYPRTNSYVAEVTGGLEGYGLEELPALPAAFLHLWEKSFTGAPRTRRTLSSGKFSFARPTEPDEDAPGVAHLCGTMLLRPSGEALRISYFGGDVDVRSLSGETLYLNPEVLFMVVGDLWPYHSSKDPAPAPPALPEELREEGGYERNETLELFTE